MLTEPLAVKPLLVIIYRHFDNTYILYISRVWGVISVVNYSPCFFHRFMRPSHEALASYLVEPETNARQAMWQSFLTGVRKKKLLLVHLAHYKDSPSKVKSKCESAVLGLKKFIWLSSSLLKLQNGGGDGCNFWKVVLNLLQGRVVRFCV